MEGLISRRPKPWKSLNQTQPSTRGGISRTACSNVATMWRLLSSRPLSRASAMQLRAHVVLSCACRFNDISTMHVPPLTNASLPTL